MARDPRRKGRPRRSGWPVPSTPARDFRAALAAEAPRNTHDLGSCLLCGAPRAFLGAWVPTARSFALFGLAPATGGAIVYALCERCREQPGCLTAVEDTILDRARGEQIFRT